MNNSILPTIGKWLLPFEQPSHPWYYKHQEVDDLDLLIEECLETNQTITFTIE